MSKYKYKTSVEEVPKQTQLRGEVGWNRMQVQFVINKDSLGSQLAMMGHTIFPPNGASHELHVHENAEELMYIMRGHGQATIGDETFEFKAGDLLFAPVNCPHIVANTDPEEEMEMLWVYGGCNTLEGSGYKHCK